MIFINSSAALCAAFLISTSAIAMGDSSLSLYGGAIQFECSQNSSRIKIAAKTAKDFSAKIKANTVSGNLMNYKFSGGATMSMGFGVSDLPIEFHVMSDSGDTENFTLDVECQIKSVSK